MVENPIIDTEGAAQTAIQYFENMRNFLVAVGQMKLLTFEVSDLEKVGLSSLIALNFSIYTIETQHWLFYTFDM